MSNKDPHKILVVDDENTTRRLLSAAALSEGMECDTAVLGTGDLVDGAGGAVALLSDDLHHVPLSRREQVRLVVGHAPAPG